MLIVRTIVWSIRESRSLGGERAVGRAAGRRQGQDQHEGRDRSNETVCGVSLASDAPGQEEEVEDGPE